MTNEAARHDCSLNWPTALSLFFFLSTPPRCVVEGCKRSQRDVVDILIGSLWRTKLSHSPPVTQCVCWPLLVRLVVFRGWEVPVEIA